MIAYSHYQEAIFEAVQRGEQALVVTACPGAGKTTTIKEMIRFLPEEASVLALAFNKHAAMHLQMKIDELPGHQSAVARTIHSIGLQTLTKAGINGTIKSNKYSSLCYSYLREMHHGDTTLAPQMSRLIDMVRLTLSETDIESLLALCDRFDIDLNRGDSKILRGIPTVLSAGIKEAQEEGIIDFTDMVWLPCKLHLRPPQFDYVLVDEAQDLSPAQRMLVLKARGGAFIAVGDPHQAIYGFAGASLHSIDEIVEATQARTLPLSICYRCPRDIIHMAARIYPGIEAAPGASAGSVGYITPDAISDRVAPGDLVLCRLNAPLVDLCLDLLRQGMRAKIQGRDLGATLTGLLARIQKAIPCTWQDFPLAIQEYRRQQIEALNDHAMRIAALQDKIDTLLALHAGYKARERQGSLEGFTAYIKSFFSDDPGAQIILSTGHRAKGLEFERVFILNHDQLPHPRAKTQDALTQERNLMYVMYTRAKSALFLAESVSDKEDDEE